MAKPSQEPVFDLSGGAPCLDFANTLEGRGEERPRELLGRYDDLVVWGRQAGLLDDAQAAALGAEAAAHPRQAASALGRARRLREAIFRLFAGHAAGAPPVPADLEVLNEAVARAQARRTIEVRGGGFGWRWPREAEELDRVLWPVARSAAEILTSERLAAVRECAADTCRWLFLDASRNRSRRWCDMKVCGNRSKARRHYRRKQRQSAE